MTFKVPTDQVCKADVLQRIKCKIDNLKSTMKSRRTALLWFQYMDMVNILQMFIIQLVQIFSVVNIQPVPISVQKWISNKLKYTANRGNSIR